jgi:hypothetical protein
VKAAVRLDGLFASRHPSTRALAVFFTKVPVGVPTAHRLDDIRNACADLAASMIEDLPDGPELTAGLRKLLEAKDCFVRAAL